MDDWRAINRALWDDRVPGHLSSEFYDVEGFRAGRPAIRGFEVDELGALGDLRLVHLQCHFGLDTLDLARQHPTLQVVGLDFSVPAIEAARSLADEVGLADRARFVAADVYDAVAALDGERFDVVYTGKGALNWLPDLDSWAGVVRDLLRPGGRLYLVEFHPVAMVLGEDQPVPELDYFSTEPVITANPESYAGGDVPTTADLCYEWLHSLGDVLDALIGAGLVIRFLHEWPFTFWQANPALVRADGSHGGDAMVARVPTGARGSEQTLSRDRDGYWGWPGPGTLPLVYSIRAERPEP